MIIARQKSALRRYAFVICQVIRLTIFWGGEYVFGQKAASALKSLKNM
jgi:hypothetical protein